MEIKFNSHRFICLFLLVVGIHLAKGEPLQQENSAPLPTNQIIEEAYKDITGFGIGAKDAIEITNLGGAPTYGEITYEAIKTLINELKPTKKDVFYDLGCGVGKAVTQMYLDSPVKKSIGIELSSERYDKALIAKTRLQEKGLIKKNRQLEFKKENIAQTNLHDATIVYLCSTCYSEELMKAITENLAQAKKNVRIITLKTLPNNNKFELIKEYQLPMTWSKNSTVYLYQRKNHKGA